MTRTERLKLAKAARELAADCERGAVRFGPHASFDFDGHPVCALGHLYCRAFGSKGAEVYADTPPIRGEDAVWKANDGAPEGERHLAVVGPLKRLADELESRHD